MLKQKNLGQSTAEYAIVIGLVIAAAVAMQIYVKRGLQGKMKGAVDYSPDTKIFTTKQFEPAYSDSVMNTTKTGSTTVETKEGGGVERRLTAAGEVTKSTGTQTTLGVGEY
ncbi:MAG: hypothetical protein WC543_00925 [Candidatus Omnitrophota bacterium]